MEQQFVSILKGTLFAPFFWICVFYSLFFIFKYCAYRRAKARKKTKKTASHRNDLQKSVVILVVLLAISAVMSIDTVKDINNRSFCSVHGDFVEHSYRTMRTSYHYYTVTTDDGEEFDIRIPLRLWLFEQPDLPDGKTFHGTMWYSENSHYALKFVPDEG